MFKSVCAFTGGRLEHLYVCMDKKAQGHTDWGSWLKLKGETLTQTTLGKPIYLLYQGLESQVFINDKINCLLWQSKVCFA